MEIGQRTNQKASKRTNMAWPKQGCNGWQDFVTNGNSMHVYALEIAAFPRGKRLDNGLVL